MKKDLGKALELHLRAAEKGWGLSEVKPGEMYETGEGVRQDIAEAGYWYERAEFPRPVSMAAAMEKLQKLSVAFPEEYVRGRTRYMEELKSERGR